MMEMMSCMSNDDCIDTPMKGVLDEFVDGSRDDSYSCGWIEMQELGEDMTTTDDFCMPTNLCG